MGLHDIMRAPHQSAIALLLASARDDGEWTCIGSHCSVS
jgi:hypothetical protein